MEASRGLVAGSRNRKELVVIRWEPKPLSHLSGQLCQICGDDVGLNVDGELFVACNECAFLVCRTCYEYELREGSQVCPQCKTRYKRLRGCARVARDEEDDTDDVENEFNFTGRSKEEICSASPRQCSRPHELRPRRGRRVTERGQHHTTGALLLTNGELVMRFLPSTTRWCLLSWAAEAGESTRSHLWIRPCQVWALRGDFSCVEQQFASRIVEELAFFLPSPCNLDRWILPRTWLLTGTGAWHGRSASRVGSRSKTSSS